MISSTRALKLMGNMFAFHAIHEDEALRNEAIEKGISEIQRIEQLLTTFDAYSITAEINRNAGMMPVTVSAEVFDLIQRSVRISQLTQGAFDLTYGSVDKSLWNFDTAMPSLPDAETAQKRVHLVDYRKIHLDERKQTVFLEKRGMRIGFGGIGKGYAAGCAQQVMQSAGVENGLVNAAGDLTAWGNQENGKPWTIGIADPNKKETLFSSIKISGMSVATSGDYEKYVTIDGVRYSHTIDPRTGLPAKGMKSVTVICPVPELADALTTPVMIMGTEAGLHLINQLHHVEAVIIDHENQMFTSKNILVQ